jgi:fengycin family lipopeptide synthetase B
MSYLQNSDSHIYESLLFDDWLDKERGYWRDKLSGHLHVTGLPLDFKRPEMLRAGKQIVSMKLDMNTTSKLLNICTNKYSLLFTFFVTALKILLYKYSGTEDVIVGTTIHEEHKELASLNKVLVLRDKVWGSITAKDLLLNVQRTVAEAYANQKYPFEHILSMLGAEYKSSRFPLFDVIVILKNINNSRHIAHLNNDITLSFEVKGADIIQEIEYSEQLFKVEAIEIARKHLHLILSAMLDNLNISVSEVSLLSDEKRHELLYVFNNTRSDYPREKTVTQLFESQVEKSPEAIAVVSGREEINYRELNRRANQLGHYLKALGVKPGGRVGIYLDHSLEMITGILGTLKAGAIYVPMDPTHPTSRLTFLQGNAEIEILLTQQHLTKESLPNNGRTISLDSEWCTIAQESDENLLVGITSDSLAYIIYTSGSTGEPKGVKIPHSALVNYIWWATKTYLQGEKLAFPLYSSLSFDLTATSIFTPLITGNTILIFPRKSEGYPIQEIVMDNRVGILKLTPSHLSLIKDNDNRKSRIKRLIVGGEALETNLARHIYDSFAGVEIYNEYGPTEATVGCMIHKFDPDEDNRSFVPIGRPAANVQIYILDQFLNPVSENVTGDLYISGDGLADGYLNREALNSEMFIPNPFIQGKKMYKTGDLARWLPERLIEYLGRCDNQVKYHGHRVELNEIRSVLNRHPLVRDSVVTVSQSKHGNDVMIAYYAASQPIESAQLRAFVAESIIAETIPNLFVHLKRLPLTINGKVNYQALPRLDQVRQELSRSMVAPQTPAEKMLVQIWAEVLGLERIGVHDNFFELGGDSILSIQVIARANHQGLKLAPRQLFERQTVARLAEVAGILTPTIGAEVVAGTIPLTPIQRWWLEADPLVPHHYNQAVILQTTVELNGKILERALQHLQRHHDGLRLRLRRQTGQWEQWIEADNAAPLCLQVDLSMVPDPRQARAVEAIAAQLQTSLELERGPVWRAAFMQLGAEQPGRLLLIIHHIAVDGVSWRILLEDLEVACRQISQGEAPVLPERTTSFQHWARLLEQEAISSDRSKELDYWLGVKGTGRLAIEGDRTENTRAEERKLSLELEGEATEALLRRVQEAYPVRVQEVLLTALAQALNEWAGTESVLVEVEGHGREELADGVDLSRTVGWFTSLYPVCLRWERGEDLGQGLQQIKEQLRMVPSHGFGYGLLRYLNPETCQPLQGTERGEVSFNYLGQFDGVWTRSGGFALAAESPGAVHSPQENRRYLIELNAYVSQGRLKLHWNYGSRLCSRQSIEKLAGRYLESLRRLIAYCLSSGAVSYAPSDFPLANLDREQLQDLLEGFNEALRGK